MKFLYKRLLPIVLTVLMLLNFPGSISSFQVQAAGPVTASEFAKAMNAGWNLGNSLDSHYGNPTGDGNLGQETVWGQPKTTQAIIDYVKSKGFNTVRIPVSWYYHTYKDASGVLHVHPDWLNRVNEVVNYCLADNLYVIMDSHHDSPIFRAGVSDKDFAQVKADVASVWGDVASYFASCDNHLIFESFNEVDNMEKNWQFGSKAASQMNEMNQIFVDTVRKSGGNNSERILMVPTLLDGLSSQFLKAFKLPSDTVKDRLLVTVHYYPTQFDQGLEPTFTELEQFSKKLNTPLVIGEWGTRDTYSPAAYRAVHASNFAARASAHGLKYIYWDNGSDFAIINRFKLLCNNDMINAIMKPVAYTSEESEQLNKWSDYMYMTLDQKTGELIEDKHWGTIIVSQNNTGWYPVPSGKTLLSISLIRKNDMDTQAFHYLYFYDANGTLLSMDNNWNGYTEKTVEIPAGSAYVRVGINSAYTATSQKAYKKAIEAGDLRAILKFN